MDNQKCTVVEHMHDECHIRCISWRSIFVGALVGVGLSFLLNLFSLAIGLTAFTTTKEGVTVFAVGGFIGLAIGSIVSMFVAGWVAGYLGRPYCFKRNLGTLYGFTTWCLALVFLVALSGPVTKFISSYSAHINNGVTVVEVTRAGDAVQRPAAVLTAEETEKAANDAGKAALAIFALSFFAAFASCLGGHCGMTCRKDEYSTTLNNPRI